MTGDKVKRVAAEIADLVLAKSDQLQRSMGFRKIRPLWAERCYDGFVHDMNPSRTRPLLLMKHLLYMADEVPKHVAAGKIEKALRWLGFMQGVLWAIGAAPLEELKRMTLPDEEKAAFTLKNRGTPEQEEPVFTSSKVTEVVSVIEAVRLATSELRRLLGAEPLGLLIEEVKAGDDGLWHLILSTLSDGEVRVYRAFTVFARDNVAATDPPVVEKPNAEVS